MIIITGATGFIGRRLIPRIVQSYAPDQLLCLVHADADNDLERSGRAVLDQLGIRYLPVDLMTGAGLAAASGPADILFHLASNTDTGAHDHRINTVGTKLLLDAVRPRKMIFTSTISVSDHRVQPDEPGHEDSELLRPRSEYGRSKLATEQVLKARCAADGFGLAMLRVSATYGSGTRPGGLFDALVQLAQRDSLLARFDYPGSMSMMCVDDVADVLVRMSQLDLVPGQHTTFIAEAEVLSLHEMAAAIYAAVDRPFRPVQLPHWFWWLAQRGSLLIYALEPLLPHGWYNKIWQLTLLVNNGYHNVSHRLKQTFPDKVFLRFRDHARVLLPPPR